MRERLPESVDPVRLARRGAVFEGSYPLEGMERLKASLVETGGEAKVYLRFDSDAQNVPYILVRVEAELMLECQVCLEPCRQTVHTDTKVALIAREAQADRLPEEYEPLVIGEEPLFLKELVQDELILALPVIARHSEGECSPGSLSAGGPAKTNDDGPARDNPFSVLAKLRKNGNLDEES